ncbi:MAG: hypothetical protein ACT4QC_19335 [Planctomycetaceae bacterium]
MKNAFWTSRFSLPLLAKELIEQAARRRTYVVRVGYACLLFVAACLLFYSILLIGATSPFAVLGRGSEMFAMLMGLQFAGVYLFMPAITGGLITQEKERNSLVLLFLTKLGPWTILFEKLLSRVIPMGCFLLLSLPLLAYAYSLGGITHWHLWIGVWMLFVAVLQAGSLALLCSTVLRTTVGSLIGSYVLLLATILGPMFVLLVLTGFDPNRLFQTLRNSGTDVNETFVMFPLVPAFIHFSLSLGTGLYGLSSAALYCVPTLLQCGVCLIAARVFLVRQAFAGPRNPLRELFQVADRAAKTLNENRVTRGVTLIGDGVTLPETQPIFWRETTKRSLGRTRYLARVLVAIETPLVVLWFLIAAFTPESMSAADSLLLFLVWLLAALIVSVHAASLIAGERTHQTLDVLCVTPLAGRDILLQKFRGVQRVILVLLIPFVTLTLLQAFASAPSRNFHLWRYVICAGLAVSVYLPLVAWFSFLVGLLVKTQSRAIVGALGGIVGWCVLPLVFIFMPVMILFEHSAGPKSALTYFGLLSPAFIIPMNEFNLLDEFTKLPWVAVVLNFLGYGFALVVIRGVCLNYADQWLGRAESDEK